MNETTKKLATAGVHIGYKTSMWNPKMAQYIYDTKEDIHLIDLNKTQTQITIAEFEITKQIKNGKNILFVGTKEQSRDVIEKYATELGMPYVNNRWTGGMLTNFTTTKKSIKKLKLAEEDVNNKHKTKKEILMVQRLLEKLKTIFGGILNMKRLPSLIVVIDPVHEHLAVAEANKLGIPVIAICDTNANIDKVNFVIPGNVCSEKSINVIFEIMLGSLSKSIIDKQITNKEIELL